MNLKKLERYLRVNLLGPGPRLIKKEFTGPRSHKGWETLFYSTVACNPSSEHGCMPLVCVPIIPCSIMSIGPSRSPTQGTFFVSEYNIHKTGKREVLQYSGLQRVTSVWSDSSRSIFLSTTNEMQRVQYSLLL